MERTRGKNCQSHDMSSQFSREGGMNPFMSAMMLVLEKRLAWEEERNCFIVL
jgi:hypothetical protein